MKTDDLIGMLAQGAGAAPRAVVARRFAPVFILAFPAAVLMALFYYQMVPAEIFEQWGWWVKFFYALGVAALAMPVVARLGRPASSLRGAVLLLSALLGAMMMLGIGQLMVSSPEVRINLLMGQSSEYCSLSILLVSLPALGLGLWAMRGLAPTRAGWAGWVTGLLAGGIGAAGYALVCEEVTMPFVAIWYTFGMLLPALLGALLGPRVLRW